MSNGDAQLAGVQESLTGLEVVLELIDQAWREPSREVVFKSVKRCARWDRE